MENKTLEQTKQPTEQELKELRIFEMTGKNLLIKDLIKKEVSKEKKKIADKAVKDFRESVPMKIEDFKVGNRKGGYFLGKNVSDNEIAKALRRLTMRKTFNLLSQDRATLSPAEMDLYSKLIVKLAGSVLPRIQEITGADGEQLTIHISKEIAEKNNIIEVQASQEDSKVAEAVLDSVINEEE